MTEQFESSDLYLIAAFLCRGCLYTMTRHEGRRVFFIFEETEALKTNVRDYFADRLLVGAQDYANQVQNVKKTVFNL